MYFLLSECRSEEGRGTCPVLVAQPRPAGVRATFWRRELTHPCAWLSLRGFPLLLSLQVGQLGRLCVDETEDQCIHSAAVCV